MWRSAKLRQSPARDVVSRNEGLIDSYWTNYLPPDEDAAEDADGFLQARTPDWSVTKAKQRPQTANLRYSSASQRPFVPLEVPKGVWRLPKEQVTTVIP